MVRSIGYHHPLGTDTAVNMSGLNMPDISLEYQPRACLVRRFHCIHCAICCDTSLCPGGRCMQFRRNTVKNGFENDVMSRQLGVDVLEHWRDLWGIGPQGMKYPYLNSLNQQMDLQVLLMDPYN